MFTNAEKYLNIILAKKRRFFLQTDDYKSYSRFVDMYINVKLLNLKYI